MDGILIVSHGITDREIRRKTVDAFFQDVQKEFYEIPVYQAFTSRQILKRIYDEQKISIDTPEQALKRMSLEGISKVFLQPMLISHGTLNERIFESTKRYQQLFDEGIFYGMPLLLQHEEYHRVAKVITEELEKYVSRETSDTAVILAGHGNDMGADLIYQKFEEVLNETGYKNIFVGTLKGRITVKTIMERVRKKDVRRVVLVPFMFSAGVHVMKDLAGDNENSWKCLFEKEGYETECVLKGLGEYKEIRKCYVRGLKKVMDEQ